jgi:2-hydroxy-6-oxonona-2,4-dienedioate hydrolase
VTRETPITDEVSAAREELARIERAASRHDTTLAGRRVVWRRFGAGPPLVLLHGGHGNWLHWVRNIEPLSRHRTLWLPDMPSYGDSDDLEVDGRAPDAMDRMVAAVAGSMAEMLGAGALPVDLAGFSFGGFVAARLAAQGLVRRLALIGPAGHGERRPPSNELVDWRTLPLSEQPAALRHNMATLMLHDPATIDAMALAVYESQLRTSRFNSKAVSRSGGLQAALAAHAWPVLLAWGAHDITAAPQDIAPQLAAGCRDAKWCIVEGAGHWAQYERAEEVSSLLAQWFSVPATPACVSP